MKIGIDARFWGHAGPGRYVKNLVLNLEQIDKENDYVVFLNPLAFQEFRPHNPHLKKVKVDVPWYSFSEQIKLPFIFAREKLDLLHIPHYNIPVFYPGKIVVTIHDLTIHRFSTVRATTRTPPIYWFKRLIYLFVFCLAIMRARRIFVPTEFVKNDLLKTYTWLNPRKILVTYEGVDERLKVKNGKLEVVLGRYGIRLPYILYVGSMYPHKNLSRLVEAFELVSEEYENLSLVLVGKRDFFQERLRKEIAATEIYDKVIFPAFKDPTGYLGDDALSILYKEALFFVFPSLSEGFGLPPLEAMNLGAPVAASQKTSIPEVCGGAALYFDPENVDDMAQKMKALTKNQTLRDTLVQEGYKNLERFSWEKTAKRTLEGYRSCLAV